MQSRDTKYPLCLCIFCVFFFPLFLFVSVIFTYVSTLPASVSIDFVLRMKSELTGITPEILAANNARSFREVWPRFATWLAEIGGEEVLADGAGAGGKGGGLVLAAHNAGFDHNFLIAELSRGGFNR